MTLTAPLLCTLLVGVAAGADEPARQDGRAPKGRLVKVKLAGRELVWTSYVKETVYKEVRYTEVDPNTGRETEVVRRVPENVTRSIVGRCPVAGAVAYDRNGEPVRLEDLPRLLEDGREALVIPGAGTDADAYRGLKTGRILLILPLAELK